MCPCERNYCWQVGDLQQWVGGYLNIDDLQRNTTGSVTTQMSKLGLRIKLLVDYGVL